MVDFNTLVWPPPELRPPPTPDNVTPYPDADRPILAGSSTSNTAGYVSYPQGVALGYKYSMPRPDAPPTPENENNMYSRLARERAPLPLEMYPKDCVDSSGNPRRFGCKDYPAGYVPTPRPASPTPSSDSSEYYFHPEDPRPIFPRSHSVQPRRYRPSSTQSNPLPFFEPSVPVTNPYPYERRDDFLLPVMENGRVVSHCRVSGQSGLSPDGYIEQGLPTPSPTEPSPSGYFKPRGVPTPSPTKFSKGPRPRKVDRFTPSPIVHKITHRTSDGYFHTEDDPNYTMEQFRLDARAHDEITSMKRVHTTRLGFWNRRGDHLTVMGVFVPVPRDRAYPPDLAQYPKYALMDENGRTVLPDKNEDRLSLWRTVVSNS